MEGLVLHAHTKTQVAQFIGSPSHALLLVGTNGIGKTCIAEAIAAGVLQLAPEKLHQHPYFTIVRSEKDSISIDAVRQLQRFLQLKTLGSGSVRRVLIVEHAEQLTTEAQNAYLKLLEEPPADTLMILTVDNQRALLPTILSRLQQITVYAPGEAAVKAYFVANNKDTAAVNQAFFLSGGLPGLMQALLADDQTHPLLDGVTQAKAILQTQLFEQLVMAEGLSRQKDSAKYVIAALQHIAQTMVDQSAQRGDQEKLRQWHRVLKAAAEADTALSQNANAKLVLSTMMFHLH